MLIRDHYRLHKKFVRAMEAAAVVQSPSLAVDYRQNLVAMSDRAGRLHQIADFYARLAASVVGFGLLLLTLIANASAGRVDRVAWLALLASWGLGG